MFTQDFSSKHFTTQARIYWCRCFASWKRTHVTGWDLCLQNLKWKLKTAQNDIDWTNWKPHMVHTSLKMVPSRIVHGCTILLPFHLMTKTIHFSIIQTHSFLHHFSNVFPFFPHFRHGCGAAVLLVCLPRVGWPHRWSTTTYGWGKGSPHHKLRSIKECQVQWG